MNDNEKTIQEYIDEIARLSDLLAERDRIDAENSMFSELFPDVDRDSIPDSVAAEAKERNIPLVAAYAIYDRRRQIAAASAALHNKNNEGRSSGPVGSADNFGESLSIEQIRAMSPSEVRKHYKQIMKTLSNK